MPHRKVRPPKDQSFQHGFAIEMDHYGHNPRTGKRDLKITRETARFNNAEDLAEYWEQNRKVTR